MPGGYVVSDHEYDARISRVEGEVGGLRQEVGTLTNDVAGLKADVKGLGGILVRIEQGVIRAQEKSDSKEDRNRPNLIAVVSVIITLISILVGGAWMIGGAIARGDERDIAQDRQLQMTYHFRDREADRLRDDLKRDQDRRTRPSITFP
jgi:hypothetical protein